MCGDFEHIQSIYNEKFNHGRYLWAALKFLQQNKQKQNKNYMVAI